MKKPFPWYGGKDALAPFLVSLLPPHDIYVEVFGGSAALLFAKKPSKIEIYNDIDSGLVNFFRVLRNREQVEELQQLLNLTPYSREEYYHCLETWQNTDDPIEKARRWYTVVLQGFSGQIGAGWRFSKDVGSNPASKFRTTIKHLPDFIERMKLVQVDQRTFEEAITFYDSPSTCFYLDPPYVHSTRGATKVYNHEMTEADHERLLLYLNRIQGTALLSGYNSPLYQDCLKSWECIKKDITCSAVGRTRASGVQGEGKILSSQMRTECIWRNAAAVERSQSLWNINQHNSYNQLGGSEAKAVS